MTPLQSVLYSFDTGLDRWEVVEVRSGEIPTPRSFHAMTASESDIYVFGGCPSKVRNGFGIYCRPMHYVEFTQYPCVWTTKA